MVKFFGPLSAKADDEKQSNQVWFQNFWAAVAKEGMHIRFRSTKKLGLGKRKEDLVIKRWWREWPLISVSPWHIKVSKWPLTGSLRALPYLKSSGRTVSTPLEQFFQVGLSSPSWRRMIQTFGLTNSQPILVVSPKYAERESSYGGSSILGPFLLSWLGYFQGQSKAAI